MNALNPSAFDENTHEHNDAEGCRLLWQAVLERAFLDATYEGSGIYDAREQPVADSYIRGNGRDFQKVCDLAGMDGDFLSEAYRAGKVDRTMLKSVDGGRSAVIPKGGLGDAVLAAMTKPRMAASEITKAMNAAANHNFSSGSVGDCLRNMRRAGKAVSTKIGDRNFWSKPGEQQSPRALSKFDQAILKAIDGEMNSARIAEKVSQAMGEKVTHQSVTRQLRGPLSGHAVVRKKGRVPLWSLAREPHVSCKDRIAAAVREAGA